MLNAFNSPMITLTVIKGQKGQPLGPVSIDAAQLLGYEQQTGFTRLWVRGAKWLDVKEDTDEIDRLIRAAASTAAIASKWIKSDSVNRNLEQRLNTLTPIESDWMADGRDRTPLAP